MNLDEARSVLANWEYANYRPISHTISGWATEYAIACEALKCVIAELDRFTAQSSPSPQQEQPGDNPGS